MRHRAPDPHNIRNLAAKQATVIDQDRECAGCGYNLRGLAYGKPCPECGMPSGPPPNMDDPLSLMPVRVIVVFIRGCWIAATCIGAMVGMFIADRLGVINHETAMLVLLGMSMAWIGATILLTPAMNVPQAVARGFSYSSRLRRFSRWLQLGWVVAVGCAAFQAHIAAAGTGGTGSPTELLLSAGVWVGCGVGLSGIVILSLLMERLSEWVRDDSAQRMFNWAMFSLPLALVLIVPVGAFISGVSSGNMRRIVPLFILLWVAAIGTFPYGLFLLSKSVTLSVIHLMEHRDRSARQHERRQQYFEKRGLASERAESQPNRQGLPVNAPPGPRIGTARRGPQAPPPLDLEKRR